MALTSGTRLGIYEITAAIGEGGMGQVYRATDTLLKRQVALKVLPASVAADADRLARFQREAEVLAALNHPNIAAIYGLERSTDATALVMELVEGQDLAEIIGSGPKAQGSGLKPQGSALPIDEALAIAKQIADALEAAHDRGIVHRDLKPANIKVRSDGTVKVLDFGLAKAIEPVEGLGSGSGSAASMSPTITSPAMTAMGMILGTAAYMAPEQASGRPVDKRADIWAFGVVLWEMLAGRQMFEGETVSHVIAAVLTKEPDLGAVPQRVRYLVARCLEKDPKKRLRDIGDAMSLVQNTGAGPDIRDGAADSGRSRRWIGAIGWVAAGVFAAGLAAAVWLRPSGSVTADQPIVRFQIQRPADAYNRTSVGFAVSPDGRMLAYYDVGSSGTRAVFVRTLATGEAHEVQGSATAIPGGAMIFWSPDSRQLVRGTSTLAHVFDVAAGTSQTLCDCRYLGGSWNRDGVILLGAVTGGGIERVSATDHAPVPVTKVDASRSEQDSWPVFLPDGRRFLFTRSTPGAADATYVGSLDGGGPKRLVDGSYRAFVPAANGRGAYLLGIDAAGLEARPVDPNTLSVTGSAVTLVPGAIALSASENGVLATTALGSRPRTIPTWFDRKGTSLGEVGAAGQLEGIALSPDGRKLAASDPRSGQDGSPTHIWLSDLTSGASTRVTFGAPAEGTPVWSPDGTRIVFSAGAQRGGVRLPYQRAADGTGAETLLFPFDRVAYVNDWSNDGRWVIFSTPKPNGGGNELWVVPMEGSSDHKPVPYIVAAAIQQQAQFSPDGRFVAYGSDQSGTWEIYVQPFPNASEGKWMVSSGGGVEPRWSRDGKELFYFSGQTLMAVPVSLHPTFSNGTPAALFKASVVANFTQDSHRWQLAPDGKRFLLLTTTGKDQGPPVDIVVNWPAMLKK